MIKNNYLILDEEFNLYCKINKIEDTNKLAKKIFDRGFAIEKYGETPYQVKGQEKIIEKEIIKEVIVEKIIEVIKEVPVEKNIEVIKEVLVEKNVNDVCTDLIKENELLKLEIQKMTDALENFNKGTYLKNSNLNNLYSE